MATDVTACLVQLAVQTAVQLVPLVKNKLRHAIVVSSSQQQQQQHPFSHSLRVERRLLVSVKVFHVDSGIAPAKEREQWCRAFPITDKRAF